MTSLELLILFSGFSLTTVGSYVMELHAAESAERKLKARRAEAERPRAILLERAALALWHVPPRSGASGDCLITALWCPNRTKASGQR